MAIKAKDNLKNYTRHRVDSVRKNTFKEATSHREKILEGDAWTDALFGKVKIKRRGGRITTHFDVITYVNVINKTEGEKSVKDTSTGNPGCGSDGQGVRNNGRRDSHTRGS